MRRDPPPIDYEDLSAIKLSKDDVREIIRRALEASIRQHGWGKARDGVR